jgi:hypothetical protein
MNVDELWEGGDSIAGESALNHSAIKQGANHADSDKARG